MSAKHTPGPWKVEAPSDARSPVRIVTAEPVFPGATLPAEIAKMTKLRGVLGYTSANARMIAAAPDMYEALKQLLSSQWLSIDHDRNRTKEACALRDLACAALDKAEGRP